MTSAAAKIAELGQRAEEQAPPKSTEQRVKPLAPLSDEQPHEARLRAIVKRCRAEPPPAPPCALCNAPTVPWSNGNRGCWTCEIVQDRKGNIIDKTGPVVPLRASDGYEIGATFKLDDKGALHWTPIASNGEIGETQVFPGYIKREGR